MPPTRQAVPTEIAAALAQTPGAELRYVTREPLVLPPHSAELGVGRAVPRGIMIPFRGGPSIPARHAMEIASLVVLDAETDAPLTAGQDYAVDPLYGSLCLPEGSTSPSRSVTISYRYSLARLDRLERSPSGELRRTAGIGHLAAPVSPRLGDDSEHVAYSFVKHFAATGEHEIVLPSVQQNDPPLWSGTLPGMRAMLAAGSDVRILFFGDSITEGGDASTDRDTFTAIASDGIRAAHPSDAITTSVAAKGGSRSHQWLDDEAFPECDWARVEAAGPDVTIIEFLNDTYVDAAGLQDNYDELVRRLRALGSEVVLTTPPFTAPDTMDDGDHEGIDTRPYVHWLREYAAANRLPLIDVSRRWELLRDEGLPYWTLLANGLNHPDDRGHEMAGELIARAVQVMASP